MKKIGYFFSGFLPILTTTAAQILAAFLEEEALQTKVLRIAIPDCFVEHGSVGELKKALGLDADSVTEKILAELPEEL